MTRILRTVALMILSACVPKPPHNVAAPASIEIEPATLDFGSLSVGTTFVRTTRISNTGGASLHILSFDIDGQDKAFFSVLTLSSPTIDGGAQATLSVIYAPTAEGHHTARLLLKSDASNTQALSISLLGQGAIEHCAQTCQNPPDSTCADTQTLTTFDTVGTCVSGGCWYNPRNTTCSGTCRNGACIAVTKIKAISLARDFACALTDAGGVKCWGNNFSGNIGDATDNNNRPTPVDVVGLSSGVIALSAGGESSIQTGGHACAVTSVGGVKCWGSNDFGESDWTKSDHRSLLVPVDVHGLSSASAVAAGPGYTCALTQTGSVRCWGSGNPSTHTQTLADVINTGIATLSVGQSHICVLTKNGGVKCWGGNQFGELGDPTATPGGFSGTPSVVPNLTSSVKAVSAGAEVTCAVNGDSGALCWGHNQSCQLGDSTRTDRYAPTDVIGLGAGSVAVVATGWGKSTGRDVSGFFAHTCALTSTGGAKCWGDNFYGQLGNNSDGSDGTRCSPVDVTGLNSGVRAIAVGGEFTCALTNSGGVKCWGLNDVGQLGTGAVPDSKSHSTPADVLF